MKQEDDIFEQPQPDEFKTESPLRAFTDFNADGEYAIGRGFRPAVQHLPKYLTAIREKTGWKLLQIMYAGDPTRRSMVFERAGYGLGEPARANRLEDYDWENDPAGLKVAYPMVAIPPMDISTGKPAEFEHGGVTFATYEPSDDPVNPKHYAGTACAEIGERLTPNGYQILKYCWRLGEKDDPVIELGKALWYLDREAKMGSPSRRYAQQHKMNEEFVVTRTEGKGLFVGGVARRLWDMSQNGLTEPQFMKAIEALRERIELKREEYKS